MDLDLSYEARKAADWKPTNRDKLERALSMAAAEARMEVPDEPWCEFLKAAGDLLIGRDSRTLKQRQSL